MKCLLQWVHDIVVVDELIFMCFLNVYSSCKSDISYQQFPMSHNCRSRTMKLTRKLPSSTAACYSSCRSECVDVSALSDQSKHFRILIPNLENSGVPGGVQTPPPKLRRTSKIVPNSTRLWKLLKIAEFRTPIPQDVRKKSSKILKLPSVCNCFTSAMTNKLVVIINSLKIPKVKKLLL